MEVLGTADELAERVQPVEWTPLHVRGHPEAIGRFRQSYGFGALAIQFPAKGSQELRGAEPGMTRSEERRVGKECRL